MAKRKSTRQAKARKRQSLLWLGAFVVLLVAIGISGLVTVATAHEMRGLYSRLGDVQREQDRLLEEHSRLMLERGALGSMQNIEKVAASELGMQFPEDIGQVLQ